MPRPAARSSCPTCRAPRSTSTATTSTGREDLYDTATYAESLDARAYAWSQTAHDRDASMAKALHDHAVDEALADWVAGRRLVGVMGGHALERGTDGYRDAARLGLLLGAGHVVATGGGPGAMEAANLGAYLSGRPGRTPERGRLDEALDLLAAVPSFRPSVDDWVRAAFAVRERFPGGADSLGIPTWFYGHEPPNVLANAHRQVRAQRPARVGPAGGLPRRHRVPARPGGTVQEVFQDACENYYADESSVAPDGAGRSRVLDRGPARLAAAPDAGPGPADGTARPPRRRRGRRRRAVRRMIDEAPWPAVSQAPFEARRRCHAHRRYGGTPRPARVSQRDEVGPLLAVPLEPGATQDRAGGLHPALDQRHGRAALDAAAQPRVERQPGRRRGRGPPRGRRRPTTGPRRRPGRGRRSRRARRRGTPRPSRCPFDSASRLARSTSAAISSSGGIESPNTSAPTWRLSRIVCRSVAQRSLERRRPGRGRAGRRSGRGRARRASRRARRPAPGTPRRARGRCAA